MILVNSDDHYFYLTWIHESDITVQLILSDQVRVMKDPNSVRACSNTAPVRLFALPSSSEVERLYVPEVEARGVQPVSGGLEYHSDHNLLPTGHSGQVRK